MTECTVTTCDQQAKCQGLCLRHYHRLKRHGDPEAGGPFQIADVRKRWLSLVRKSESCWLWQGQLNNKGYGLISSSGRKRGAHQVGYELFVGPVPEGLELDHLCRVPACVNPAHLEPVTHAENQRRMGAALKACRRAGHPYTEENTYRSPRTGRRSCRECARNLDRIRTANRSAARKQVAA